MGSFRLESKLSFIFILFFSTILILSTFNVSAVDTYYTNHYPAKNSTITVSNPKISVYVKSVNELNDSSVMLWINGNQVDASFFYKGSWVNDYYEGRVWRISDRREGTISFDASNLTDGVNKLEVSIKDKSSTPNIISDTWSFTVKEPPKINNISPANKSKQTTLNKLTMVVSDNTSVDWDTVQLKINNVVKSPQEINTETGVITYNHDFTTGSYTAVLEVMDSAVNKGIKTWNFIVDSVAPELVNGFKDGTAITDGP